jgi:predicted nucleic acid-binding protein
VIWFVDTSVLVKRYVSEADSPAVMDLFRGRRRFAVSALAAVEVRSALYRRVAEALLRNARRARWPEPSTRTSARSSWPLASHGPITSSTPG